MATAWTVLCTGHGDGYSIVVDYVETEEQVKEFWPEAVNVDVHRRDCQPVFTDRFLKPDWWAV